MYEIRPRHRRDRRPARAVAEPVETYGEGATPSSTVHAVVHGSGGFYVAECLEVAVVTQGRSLDETVANLREAVELLLEGEDPRLTGVIARPRIALTYELDPARS